jgi:probable rRNA maturation factor
VIVLLVNKQKRRIARAGLLRVARAAMAAEGCDPGAELSLAIGDDAWIQELNRRYKGRNRPTDVLAFPQAREPTRAKSAAADRFAPAVGGQRQGRSTTSSRFGRSLLLPPRRGQQPAAAQHSQSTAPRRRATSPNGPAVSGALLGDVAVSAETAARQAREAGHSLMAELALLVTHGILHLTGWQDRTPAQRKRMMARATELLARSAPGPSERQKRAPSAKTS